MKKIIVLCIILIALLGIQVCFAEQSTYLYKQARKSVKHADYEFALIYYSKIVSDFPQSRFYKNSLFAIGEYYFEINDYLDSRNSFIDFIDSFPDSSETLFVYMYLLKIAQLRNDQEEMELLKKHIVCFRQISLLFRDYKVFRLRSDFKEYKALYYIDKVEFFVDDKIFQEINY
ncbi:MAG: outer membrane protein assembly factor BamD [Candidatus Gygaella obscura]|nr:outer membrane protein assembly factor BamD [Candidatus Gygaella obscura]